MFRELGLLTWPMETEEEYPERAIWPQTVARKPYFQIRDSLGTNGGLGKNTFCMGTKMSFLIRDKYLKPNISRRFKC